MPKNVLDKVWAYFDAAGPMVGTPWPIEYRTDEADRLARLRALGVRAFPSLLYPHRPQMAAWLNDWAAAFAAEHPDVLHTATFFPEPQAGAYVRDALERGAVARGLGRPAQDEARAARRVRRGSRRSSPASTGSPRRSTCRWRPRM